MTALPKPEIGDPCNGCGVCCRAQVCAAGSYTMKMVAKYGDRAPGPCPAIVENGDGSISCGMVLRPRDYAWGKGGAHELRAAASILIGAGLGCDEAGDPPEPDADAKLVKLQEKFVRETGRAKINAAVEKWYLK